MFPNLTPTGGADGYSVAQERHGEAQFVRRKRRRVTLVESNTRPRYVANERATKAVREERVRAKADRKVRRVRHAGHALKVSCYLARAKQFRGICRPKFFRSECWLPSEQDFFIVLK